MDCLFCKFSRHEIETKILYEDDLVMCILDAYPDSNGHCLIIPKAHTLDIDTIDDETLSHIWKIAKEMKKKIEKALGADGLTFIQNNGKVQEIKHYHLHLKPYYKNKNNLMSLDDVYKLLKAY